MSSNEGVPIITKFPREKISTDLHNVARLIVNGSITPAAEPMRRSWWASLVSRTSNA
jgi:hypothetical protein